MVLPKLTDERGFTLIELLVVILIVGILAAIAIPTFMSQRDKARSGAVKSDVRNAVSQMEACFQPYEAYSSCPSSDTLLAPGVTLTKLDADTRYRVSASAPSGQEFAIELLAGGGGYVRSCTLPGTGGCSTAGAW